ncbi:L-2-hydroxyglutarate oxidase [Glutamicibacter endophyticus]
MPTEQSFAVIGAGILGAAVAAEVLRRYPSAQITLFEKEQRVAAHQSSHNSGVVHAGLYYKPGSLKAKLCRRGVDLIENYCAEKALPYERCGKLVVALDEAEEQRLNAIHTTALANGVPEVSMLGPEGLREIEPNATGRAALHSPHTAIVDYAAVTQSLVDDVQRGGGILRTGCTVNRIEERDDVAMLHTSAGEFRAGRVISCAGGQSDRLARTSGAGIQPRIVPFFGQYFLLEERHQQILNGLVYPVPDPRYPFLGVHLTKRVDGSMTIGPNAFLSLSREKYSGLGFDPRDLVETLGNAGFWRFSAANAGAALRELRSVASRNFFVDQAARYVPSLDGASITPLPRGIRAQAMNAHGRLLDDFALDRSERVLHVRNAPSPGATSSLAMAEHLVNLLD